MAELEGRLPRAPGAAQSQKGSPCYTNPADPVRRLGDCWGIANTEPVFKKEGEEV